MKKCLCRSAVMMFLMGKGSLRPRMGQVAEMRPRDADVAHRAVQRGVRRGARRDERGPELSGLQPRLRPDCQQERTF